MIKRHIIYLFISLFSLTTVTAQINTERVMEIGRNSLYFEDYVLSIQYFNQVINAKPYWADPYFFRGAAKYSLDDFKGAEDDCSACIERNPFLVNAYKVRGLARHQMGKYQEAIEDYDQCLQHDPTNAFYLSNKAKLLTALKKYEDAQSQFDALLAANPSYIDGYRGRSFLYMERGDTIAALKDLDKAISLDKNNAVMYAIRAELKSVKQKDFKSALDDMNEAVKLEPNNTAFLINRAIVRYHLNDLRGTMADYDKVVELDKNNNIALYNRGLLRAQVGDLNKAIDDFAKVITLEPENYFAIYNQASLKHKLGDYNGAIRGYSKVIEAYPDFVDGYLARADAKSKIRDMKGADKDFLRGYDLDKKRKAKGDDVAESKEDTDDSRGTRKEKDNNINKFNDLLVAEEDNNYESKYSSEIRGFVQDRNVKIEISPDFILSYYEKPDKITKNIYYDRELDDFNKRKLLRHKMIFTNDEVALSNKQIETHFTSINNYAKIIENTPNNPLPYFGLAMDYALVQDITMALENLNKCIQQSKNFTFAYFNRAALRFKQIEYKLSLEESSENLFSKTQLGNPIVNQIAKTGQNVTPGTNTNKLSKDLALEYEMVLRDYDKVLEISPRFVYAYFNRGNVHCARRDYTAALLDYTKAITLNPNFAEAYFNRGLVYIFQGEKDKGLIDLGKAGELGMVGAYNIIKRINK